MGRCECFVGNKRNNDNLLDLEENSMKISSLAVFCLFIFTQCTSFQPVTMKENYLRLNKYNLALVSGIYMLRDSVEFEFWKEIVCKKKEKQEIKYASKLSLQFIDENKLKIKLIVNDSILKEKTIAGALEYGIFTFNKFEARGLLPPLAWGLVITKYQICATTRGFYMADDSVGQLFILVMPTIAARGWGAEDKEYVRIE